MKKIWEIIKFPPDIKEINLVEVLEYLDSEGFAFETSIHPRVGQYKYLTHPDFECRQTAIPDKEWADYNNRFIDLVRLIEKYERWKKEVINEVERMPTVYINNDYLSSIRYPANEI